MAASSPDDLVTALRSAGCVFAEEEAAVLREAAVEGGDLARLLARRVSGEPLEQVVGWARFHGVRAAVAPGVFVPRTRSGLLVDLALEHLARSEGRLVVDLCCGTGALGLAVADGSPLELHAADLDPDAVACARGNLVGVGEVHEGDLYDALPRHLRGRVDVLLVNAPYVPTDEIALMPAEARDHEHRLALDGGADGLDLHRRVAAGAAGWLADGGVLLLETSRSQASASRRACRDAGLRARVVRRRAETGSTAISASRVRSGTMAR